MFRCLRRVVYLHILLQILSMARIITISNSKGGVGKSTIALNLYNYLTAQGAACAICDLDYQKSITNLGRNINLVEVSALPYADGVSFVFVDMPPYQDAQTKRIFALSDFILIPLKASVFDLQAAGFAIELARDSGSTWGMILNMVKPSTGFTGEVRERINNLSLPLLKTEVRDRISYARSLLFNEGIEAENNKKADDEIADLANEILIKIAG